VGGYIGGGGNKSVVLGEEVPDVADLRKEEEDPKLSSVEETLCDDAMRLVYHWNVEILKYR
jgi:hypothetical protein